MVPDPGLQLIAVPAGTIELRDAWSGSARDVSLRPFEIGRTPVTWAEYQAVTDAAAPAGRQSADAPVHPVTWFDAVRWCNAASVDAGFEPVYTLVGREVAWEVSADGYRLPTEAEWEWACRAGTTGPTYGPLSEIAWSAVDQLDGPQPVAHKASNAFGAFDMLGNVWEWCWDLLDPARYDAYRVFRGGGFADDAWSVRASVRRGGAPRMHHEDVGFRVARGGFDSTDAAQGWSAAADLERAAIDGPLPSGWTPRHD